MNPRQAELRDLIPQRRNVLTAEKTN